MKITDSGIIKSGEQELIDGITADLDWGAIEDIFKKEHKLGIAEDIEYKNGDIVVFDNQIAYQLDFEVKVTLTVLLDRDGNYLSVSASGAEEDEPETTEDSNAPDDPKEEELHTGQDDELIQPDVDIGDNMDEVLTDTEIPELKDFQENITQVSSDEDVADQISKIANQVGEIIEKAEE